ncbi:MAG: putative metal-dependent HD superfamily phosphohydrolase [Polaribacter sp.]|jgi:predicted metal-dependent HD superfamily phosphohydrolase
MPSDNQLLPQIKDYVSQFITEQVSQDYVYHDLNHTQEVVEGVRAIGVAMNLTEEQLEVLQIAAWFHDTGYDQGSDRHEERSADYARSFLKEKQYNEVRIQEVVRCIMATKLENYPKETLGKVIRDADFTHLGNTSYWERCGRVRQELVLTKRILQSDQEWTESELRFMNSHQYLTEAAERLFGSQKEKHIESIKKRLQRLNPNNTFPELQKKNKKKKKKKKKKNFTEGSELGKLDLGRGVETMYRTTYRTHINLSSIADNKANIMLSINAIIISITLSTLIPRFETNEKLIIPTMILLGVCLVAVIFATLSTRPKITEGVFTRKDIENKKSNLLFFGNFYNMKFDDFHWGMMEMIKDSDFLYSSMTKDLYYLGIVLAKKYQYLRICYGVFMYGLILSVAAFAYAFLS